MRETRIWSLDWEDPLEKEMAIHSSTLAWKIPWTEEPDRLQSMGSQRVGHFHFHFQRLAGGTLSAPFGVYVRSFLYLFYTLIKLYCTIALRDQASSLAPGWTSLLQRPRILASFTAQQQAFSRTLIWIYAIKIFWKWLR